MMVINMMMVVVIMLMIMIMMTIIAGGREAEDQVPWPSCGCQEQQHPWLSTGGCNDLNSNRCKVLFM